jgi:hypothetical protein
MCPEFWFPIWKLEKAMWQPSTFPHHSCNVSAHLPPEISQIFPPSSPYPYIGTYPAAWPVSPGQKLALFGEVGIPSPDVSAYVGIPMVSCMNLADIGGIPMV